MPDTETPSQVEAFTQAKWSGALKALTQYLPHLIALTVGAIAVANHFEEQRDTNTIWQHSARWAKQADVDSLALTESNLNARISALEQINHPTK